MTDQYIAASKTIFAPWFRRTISDMIVSNIGITPDFSAIYTSNSGQHTAFVQVSLKKDHEIGSYEYMSRVRAKLANDLPELSPTSRSGGLVDAVVNLGLPAPIDIQVGGNNQKQAYDVATEHCRQDSRSSKASATSSSRRTSTTPASNSTSTAKWRRDSA